jgi:hypothetical protein
MPHVYPPLDRLQPATDGTVWVFRTVSGGASAVDVFDRNGHYLGAPELPIDFDRVSVHVITDEHLYGVTKDDLGVDYVVRLRIVRE